MASKKKSSKELFTMAEGGPIAGTTKNRLYSGKVGGFDLGTVVAANKTAGRKKLLTIARGLLK